MKAMIQMIIMIIMMLIDESGVERTILGLGSGCHIWRGRMSESMFQGPCAVLRLDDDELLKNYWLLCQINWFPYPSL
jgi:hypothetical protein